MCLAKIKCVTFSKMLVGLQLDIPFRFNQQLGGGEVGTMSPGSSGEMEIYCAGSPAEGRNPPMCSATQEWLQLD